MLASRRVLLKGIPMLGLYDGAMMGWIVWTCLRFDGIA